MTDMFKEAAYRLRRVPHMEQRLATKAKPVTDETIADFRKEFPAEADQLARLRDAAQRSSIAGAAGAGMAALYTLKRGGGLIPGAIMMAAMGGIASLLTADAVQQHTHNLIEINDDHVVDAYLHWAKVEDQ